MKSMLIACFCLVPSLLVGQGQPTPEAARPQAPPNLEPLVTEGVVQAPAAEMWRVFSTADGFTRLGVARAKGIPAFRIMSDRTMVEIVSEQPTSLGALAQVRGAGPRLIERYGQAIVEMLKAP